ncbi:3-hydroxyisobutyrate dehydrogenase [Amycolatopsis xylanica]|uniref:3-hydroxyisobutyrate dehydrogenase n=1 Tax=Amycolatopsis xylanica TaxID=589385 RepID=A0A1H2UUK6_9PSEU|nr:NAD(P)-binding domain-containing protein [Amycolatopsis xylanica]SDW59810.1 3-hydroxyisobutyrate dehydrogenase [Amycolatopsis xylanica]
MKEETTKTQVTVLGLGAMGAALASALLAAGHPVTVWNRSKRPVPQGAVRASTVSAAIEASPVVLACLLDHRSVYDALGPSAAALRGKALVNVTSGTPGHARSLAAWALEREIDYLDGGIMAVPPMIGGPGAFVLYSGSEAVFDAYRPVLDTLADSRFLGADPGMASLQDIALLSAMYGQFMGILHAFALVGSAGVPATEFAPMLSGWLTAMGGFVAEAASQIDKRDYSIDVVSNLAMQAAGYPHLLEAAVEQGVSPALLAPLEPLLNQRLADGHGAEAITGVIELLGEQK